MIFSKCVLDSKAILNVKHTEIAHDKDVNSVSISPNDKIIATGSLDKTAKVCYISLNFLPHKIVVLAFALYN